MRRHISTAHFLDACQSHVPSFSVGRRPAHAATHTGPLSGSRTLDPARKGRSSFSLEIFGRKKSQPEGALLFVKFGQKRSLPKGTFFFHLFKHEAFLCFWCVLCVFVCAIFVFRMFLCFFFCFVLREEAHLVVPFFDPTWAGGGLEEGGGKGRRGEKNHTLEYPFFSSDF